MADEILESAQSRIFYDGRLRVSSERLRLHTIVAAQRQEILGAANRLADPSQQRLQVLTVFHEVDLRGVDDQQVRRSVVKKEMLVGLDDFFEVVIIDRILAWRVLFLESLLQHLRRGVLVDHQTGGGHIWPE